VSLLGTKASTVQINYLSKFDKVITWFDNDKAGKRGSAAIRQSCGLLTNVANIITEHDPKFYSKQQIQEILCQHLK
jgi:DNA primase